MIADTKVDGSLGAGHLFSMMAGRSWQHSREEDADMRQIYLIVFKGLGISNVANIGMAVISRIWVQTLKPVLAHFQGGYEEAVRQ